MITALGCIGAVDAMGVAANTFARIDVHANSVVCSQYDDDVDGDDDPFDVVGFDQETGLPIVGARRSARRNTRGSASRSMARGHQTGSHRSGHGRRPGLPAGVNAPPWWKGTAGVNSPTKCFT